VTTTDPVDRLEAWEAALGRLQDDLDGVDRALADGADLTARPWTPPAGLGPLPEPLRERAEELLARIGRAAPSCGRRRTSWRVSERDVGRRRAAGAAYHGTAPIEHHDPTA
jgi:hypothetical protein